MCDVIVCVKKIKPITRWSNITHHQPSFQGYNNVSRMGICNGPNMIILIVYVTRRREPRLVGIKNIYNRNSWVSTRFKNQRQYHSHFSKSNAATHEQNECDMDAGLRTLLYGSAVQQSFFLHYTTE